MSKRTRTSASAKKAGRSTKRPRFTPKVKTVVVKSVEKKHLDTAITNVADVTAGVVLNSLNLIPQGITDVTRVGNKVNITDVNLHAFASMDDRGALQAVDGIVRVILFLDKQANGATATVLDILQTATLQSFRNLDNLDRFEILKEKWIPIHVHTQNATTTGDGATEWMIGKNRLNIPIHFNAAAGAITELRSNNLGLLYISNQAVANAAQLGVARVKFTDM